MHHKRNKVRSFFALLALTFASVSSAGALAQQTSYAQTHLHSHHVQLVSQLGGTTYTVAVQGNYAYFGVGPRLVILDIGNPASPALVGQTGVLPGAVRDVALAGNYAYLADYYGGLRIIDISNPAAPSETGFYGTPGEAWGVAVAGSYAYIAAGDSGLRIIDVSNPAAPRQTGVFNTHP